MFLANHEVHGDGKPILKRLARTALCYAPFPVRDDELDDHEFDDIGADLGPCGLCGRPMIAGPSINKHHLTPKTFGGRTAVWIHRICHSKIHSLFTERELKAHYDTFESLLTHDAILTFVAWVRKKPAEFYTKNKTSKRKRRR